MPEHLAPGRSLQLATRVGAMRCEVWGEGAPAIVLVNGAGVTMDLWRPVLAHLRTGGTVFAWNRLGVQGSGPPVQPQRGAAVIAGLRELLAYADVEPPWLLVAHSLGALHAQLMACLYPHEVGGLLCIAPTDPADASVRAMEEGALARSLSKVQKLPADDFQANLRAERAAVPVLVEELASVGPFPQIPVTVVAARNSAAGQRLAKISARTQWVDAPQGGHFPQHGDPEALARVIDDCAGQLQAAPQPQLLRPL